MGSSRLPGKVLLHIDERRIFEWVVERCRSSTESSDVIVAAGNAPENRAILECCERNDYQHMSGSEDNLLARHHAVAHEYDADALVRVTADSPFLPPSEIDRLLSIHRTNDARYTSSLVDPMPGGTMLDIMERSLLDDLMEADETHPAKPQLNAPDEWRTCFSGNETIEEYAGSSVAVDHPEEYWSLIDAVDAVGSDPLDVLRYVSKTL